MKTNILVLALALLPTAAMAQDYMSVDPNGGSTYYSTMPNGDVMEFPTDPTDSSSTYYFRATGGIDSPMPGTTSNGEATCDPGMCAGQ